jgi:hypothetical protein
MCALPLPHGNREARQAMPNIRKTMEAQAQAEEAARTSPRTIYTRGRISLTTRLTPVVHQQLLASAQAQGRSLSEEVEVRIQATLIGAIFAPMVEEVRAHCRTVAETIANNRTAEVAELRERLRVSETRCDALIDALVNQRASKSNGAGYAAPVASEPAAHPKE